MAKITVNGINAKQTRNGSWYVGIFTKDKEGNEVWINGFLNQHPTWQKGDEVELEIFNEEYQGVNRTRFRLPEGTVEPNLTTDGAMELHNLKIKVNSLELRLSRLEGASGINTQSEPQNTAQGQTEGNVEAVAKELGGKVVQELKVEDIPFNQA